MVPQECSHVVQRLSPPLTRGLDGFLLIKIPGGERYIGGHSTSRLEAVVADASFLSSSSLLLKRVICLRRPTKNQPITLLFTGWLISVGAKNAFNHRLPASEANMERHGWRQQFPDQVQFYECLCIFIYTTQKFSHSLCEAKVNSGVTIFSKWTR